VSDGAVSVVGGAAVTGAATRRPHVRVLFQHGPLGEPYSSSSIRLLQPFRQRAFRAAYDVSFGASLDGAPRPDVVILERLVSPDMTLQRLDALLAQIRRAEARLIYTLDDDLIDTPPVHRWASGAELEGPLLVRYLIRQADGVVVSTEALGERLARFGTPIRVVRNAIDPSLLVADPTSDAGRAGSPRRVIGYMGTKTHDEDLMLVRRALRTVLDRHADAWELEVVGALRDARLMAAFSGLPARLGGPAMKLTYPSFMAWASEHLRWDVGIAPLVDDEFTRCKSDMKLLDYSILGIPGVYSRVRPYATVRHGETGWLAPNTTDGWTEALEALITDAELRIRLAENARTYVMAERHVEVCAREWIEALRAFQETAA
jgi:glycosyltransferase involved in cell wall biosynthesis